MKNINTMRRFALSLPIASLLALPAGYVSMGVFSLQPAHAACTDAAEPGTDWSGCRKRNLIVRGSDLSNAMLIDTDLTGTDMREMKLDGADLTKANMTRSVASNSQMKGTNFERLHGARAVFSGSNMQGANFQKSEISRAKFDKSDLTGANFNKAEFSRSSFVDANLTDVDMSFSNLSRVDFTGAKLDGLNLKQSWTYLTNVVDVDLSGVKNLTQDQLSLACGSADTKLPQGLTAPETWPCGQDEN